MLLIACQEEQEDITDVLDLTTVQTPSSMTMSNHWSHSFSASQRSTGGLCSTTRSRSTQRTAYI